MLHIMIDLETVGLSANCPIMQIAAVPFDSASILTDPPFNLKVSLASNIVFGREPEQETLDWWAKQNPAIRDSVFSGKWALDDVLPMFVDWCNKRENSFCSGVTYWCCGTDFDKAILESAFKLCGLRSPWKYWQWRDYRTIREVFSRYVKYPENKSAHDALVDATYQAQCLLRIDEMTQEVSGGYLSIL